MSSRVKILRRDGAVYPQGNLFGPWDQPAWSPKIGNYAASDTERLCAEARGELIERLDDVLAAVGPPLCDRHGLSMACWQDIVQAVQLALFREEFVSDAEIDAEIAKARAEKQAAVEAALSLSAGLIPRDGVAERVGDKRLLAWLEHEFQLTLEPDAAPPDEVTVGGVSLPAAELAVLERRRQRAG